MGVVLLGEADRPRWPDVFASQVVDGVVDRSVFPVQGETEDQEYFCRVCSSSYQVVLTFCKLWLFSSHHFCCSIPIVLSQCKQEGTPVVCFEIDTFIETLPHPVLCEYDTAYTSVICWGRVHQVMMVAERTVALRLFARKYASAEKAEMLKERTVERFRSDMDAQTSVYEILLERMTGKQQLGPASS
jgi:hypothetical protein